MSTKSALRADLDAEDRKTQAEDRKPPSRDTANSATSPIRSSASLSCRSAASRTGVPSSSLHSLSVFRQGFPILGVQIGS